jgi:hypothetical protein
MVGGERGETWRCRHAALRPYLKWRGKPVRSNRLRIRLFVGRPLFDHSICTRNFLPDLGPISFDQALLIMKVAPELAIARISLPQSDRCTHSPSRCQHE